MNKEIFIWVNYGSVDVYEASTPENLFNLIKHITDILDDWNLDKKIEKMWEFIEKNKDKQGDELLLVYKKTINHLLAIAEIGSHESFENGTGWGKIKTP